VSPHGLTPRQNGTDVIASEGVLTQLRQTNRHIEPSKKTTTTRATPDLFTNGHRPNPVVVASSLAMEGDEPRDIVDKLTEEFGLSIPQGMEVETHLASKGAGYVLEKAEIVRKKKGVRNLAAAFMTALADDWKAPKSISEQHPVKKIRQTEPQNEEPQLSFEQRQAHLAEMRANLAMAAMGQKETKVTVYAANGYYPANTLPARRARSDAARGCSYLILLRFILGERCWCCLQTN
jgi:hypothetical protein